MIKQGKEIRIGFVLHNLCRIFLIVCFGHIDAAIEICNYAQNIYYMCMHVEFFIYCSLYAPVLNQQLSLPLCWHFSIIGMLLVPAGNNECFRLSHSRLKLPYICFRNEKKKLPVIMTIYAFIWFDRFPQFYRNTFFKFSLSYETILKY